MDYDCEICGLFKYDEPSEPSDFPPVNYCDLLQLSFGSIVTLTTDFFLSVFRHRRPVLGRRQCRARL